MLSVTVGSSFPLIHKRNQKDEKRGLASAALSIRNHLTNVEATLIAQDEKEFSPVAQLVEQATVNRWVAGSSPAWGAKLGSSD